MEPILTSLRKNLSQHYRWNKMIWTLAMKVIRDFFQIAKPDEWVIREKEPLDWYIRNDKLFLKTSDSWLKIEIFKQKKKLITLVNDQLSRMDYATQIDDIILK